MLKILYIIFLSLIVANCSFKKVVKHHGVPFLEKKQESLIINKTNKNDIKNIGNNIYICTKSLNIIINKVKLFYKNKETMSVTQFKEITDLSRKGAIPLLEYLDKKLYTIRSDNDRIAGETLNG